MREPLSLWGHIGWWGYKSIPRVSLTLYPEALRSGRRVRYQMPAGHRHVTISMPLLSDTRQQNCRGISIEFLFSCLLCEPYTLLRINYSYLNNWADWFTCKLCVLGIFIYPTMSFSFDPMTICTAIILIIVLLTVLATVLSSLSTRTHRGLHSPQGRE